MACPPVLPAWRSTTPATTTRVPAARGCCFHHAGGLLKHPSLCPGGVGTLIPRLPCAGAGTRCLPTFLLVGFTKTGSTAFFQYMQQHPLVRMARGKETSYLGARSLRGRASALVPMRSCQCACPRLECILPQSGTKHRFAAALDLYEACAYCERGEVRSPLKSSAGKWRMPTAGSCRTQIRRTPNTHSPLTPPSAPGLHWPGQASPAYAWREDSPAAARDAAVLLGARARLVFLVREPIERATSHFVYFHGRRFNGNLSQVRLFQPDAGLQGRAVGSSGRPAGRDDAAALLLQAHIWRLYFIYPAPRGNPGYTGFDGGARRV